MNATPVTKVPARVVNFREYGETVYEFCTPEAAARFVVLHPEAALPCWYHFRIVKGALVQD